MGLAAKLPPLGVAGVPAVVYTKQTMLYILNACPNSHLTLIASTEDSPAEKNFRKLKEDEAIEYLTNMQFVSAVGYESTAKLLSKRLDTEIEANRIQAPSSGEHDYLICAFVPPRRLAVDEMYTEEEILKLALQFFLIH